jgi:hypothetical protein
MDAFAVPQATLQQGTSWVIVTIAGEWQRGGPKQKQRRGHG